MTAATSESLIFNWDAPHRRNLVVAGFLIMSFIAHAAGFYIFQIVYPPTVALSPPPARVNLIPATSEEGRTLLRWVEAEDPALISTTRRPPDARPYALPKIEHVPSYSSIEPALKEAPPLTVDLGIPSAQPPRVVAVTGRRPILKPVPVPTTVSFSPELKAAGAANFPPPKFRNTSAQSPENLRFHVAVSSAGEILYAFPLNSSGDAALDDQARNFLALGRFPRRQGSPELLWGTATVEWGNDVGSPESVSTPTPP